MSLGIWITFAIACIVFSVAPGAGTIASISNSLSGGIHRASVNIIGLELALMLHLLIVSLGLGALLSSSATAFTILKYCGAAYLLYLGLSKFLSREPAGTSEVSGEEIQAKKVILQGFLVNMMNPKSILFLAAFLPQFISPQSDATSQYLILGVTVLVIDSAVMFTYASIAGLAKPYFSSPRFMAAQNRLFGILFITIGLSLARAER